jgi:hypothetical protein
MSTAKPEQSAPLNCIGRRGGDEAQSPTQRESRKKGTINYGKYGPQIAENACIESLCDVYSGACSNDSTHAATFRIVEGVVSIC